MNADRISFEQAEQMAQRYGLIARRVSNGDARGYTGPTHCEVRDTYGDWHLVELNAPAVDALLDRIL